MEDGASPVNPCAATCPVCYDDLEQGRSQAVDGPAPSSDTGCDREPTARQAANGVRLRACSHVFCRPCLQDYCTFTIASLRQVPITCPITKPYCDTHLSSEEVRSVLVPEHEYLYRMYLRLEEMAGDPALSSCPGCEELTSVSRSPMQESLALAGEHKKMNLIITGQKGLCQQLLQRPDPNRRICWNISCPKTVFCALHGTLHVEQTCAEYSIEQTLSLTGSISDEEDRNGSSSLSKDATDYLCAASLETIRRYTKPCPHCGAAIHKASGCDHVICPMCRQDFCFRCGTHEFLFSPRSLKHASDAAPSAFRNCSRCRQAYIDHRHAGDFRRKMCWTLPFLLVGALFYSIIALMLCLSTLCFCGCFGCGAYLDPDDARDITKAATPNETSTFRTPSVPLKGIQYGCCIILLPLIGIARDFGLACSWFPERLPGEDKDDPEIPFMAPTASEDSLKS